jgi:hypothetical protein
VYESLSTIIEQQMAKLEASDPLNAEIGAHQAFGEERARHFVGRAAMLERIDAYLRSDDRRPLAIWGESGTGKSALMAEAVQGDAKMPPEARVICRFIGATPDSSNGRTLLEDMCREISRAYGADERSVPVEYRNLVGEFPRRLALARANRRLILFLDALDQLSDADDARNLAWVPAELPPHVRLVVTTLPGDCLSALRRKLPQANVVPLEPMPSTEGAQLLDLWLAEARRTFQPHQREEVLDKFARCGLPLYLRLAFEDARRSRSYDPIPGGADGVAGLSDDVPGMIRSLFGRLSREENHGATLVSRALACLGAARNGLAEDEIVDLLSADGEVMADFLRRSPESPKVERLPVVVWSRLYADLEPYLTERRADGTALMAFYHRQLGQVVA